MLVFAYCTKHSCNRLFSKTALSGSYEKVNFRDQEKFICSFFHANTWKWDSWAMIVFYVPCTFSCAMPTKCNLNHKTTHGLVLVSRILSHAVCEPSTLSLCCWPLIAISRQFLPQICPNKMFNMDPYCLKHQQRKKSCVQTNKKYNSEK